MKKAKIIFAALMSMLMTASATAVMTANANVDIRDSDEVAKLLEGYTQIENPIAIEWQEFRIEKGSKYQINENGAIKAICPYPNTIGIETSLEIKDEEIYDVVNGICSNAEILRSNDKLQFPDTNYFEILDQSLTLTQAKEIYSKLGNNVKNFKYVSDMYNIGTPQYHLSNIYGDKVTNKVDLTLYRGLENEEMLKNFIEENKLPCHVSVIEDIKAVDVVPDDNISYIEELNIATRIYHALNIRPGFGIMAASKYSTNGNEIDLFNSVQGDANCDDETSMADAVLIMQSLANPDKYNVTAQGKYNADTDDDGITNADALTIQKKLLNLN